jgi:hypothetical protein
MEGSGNATNKSDLRLLKNIRGSVIHFLLTSNVTLLVDMRPPTPRPCSNTETSKPRFTSSDAHVNPATAHR